MVNDSLHGERWSRVAVEWIMSNLLKGSQAKLVVGNRYITDNTQSRNLEREFQRLYEELYTQSCAVDEEEMKSS